MPKRRRAASRSTVSTRRIGVPVTNARPRGMPSPAIVAGWLTATADASRATKRALLPGITLPSHSTDGMRSAPAASSTGIGDVAPRREDRRGPPAGEDRGRLRDGGAQAERIEDEMDVPLDACEGSAAQSRWNGMPAAGTSVASSPRCPPSQRSSRPPREERPERRRGPGRCARPCPRPRSAGASFQLPFSTVSRLTDSSTPIAAKLMMSELHRPR